MFFVFSFTLEPIYCRCKMAGCRGCFREFRPTGRVKTHCDKCVRQHVRWSGCKCDICSQLSCPSGHLFHYWSFGCPAEGWKVFRT